MDRDRAISELLIKVTDLTRLIEVQAEEITVLRKENSDLRERLSRFQQPEEQPQQLRAPFEGREPAEEEPEPAQAHGKEAERAARP